MRRAPADSDTPASSPPSLASTPCWIRGRSRSRDLAGGFLRGPALGQLVEQLPADQADGLRLTVLTGLSLRAAAAQLQISPMALSHREVRLAIPLPQKKALAALRQQLVGAG